MAIHMITKTPMKVKWKRRYFNASSRSVSIPVSNAFFAFEEKFNRKKREGNKLLPRQGTNQKIRSPEFLAFPVRAE